MGYDYFTFLERKKSMVGLFATNVRRDKRLKWKKTEKWNMAGEINVFYWTTEMASNRDGENRQFSFIYRLFPSWG